MKLAAFFTFIFELNDAVLIVAGISMLHEKFGTKSMPLRTSLSASVALLQRYLRSAPAGGPSLPHGQVQDGQAAADEGI